MQARFILGVALLAALCALACLPRAGAHRWGTEDAMARLERLKDDVAEQERRVDALRKITTSGSGSKSMTCSAHDQECHRQERRERRRKVQWLRSLKLACRFPRLDC